MNVHEFQAKQILREHGVAVPEGYVAEDAASVQDIAQRLGGRVVVKAQIHAGGRGKAGGVKLASSPQEAAEHAQNMLGRPLVTHQTGPEGRIVKRVLVERAYEIDRELYLGLVVDRESSRVVFMASAEGGVDIEEVAARSPEKIFKETIDPGVGMAHFQARRLAKGLGIPAELSRQVTGFMLGLYRVFVAKDCSMVEVNPLVLTAEGEVLALDAKLNFDPNALFRHPELADLRDPDEEDPAEARAAEFGLSYISLSGDIGCMVNGAGLAMATMDIIKHFGGEPANFLDVGGSADVQRVTEAFKIILADSNVKGVLVNIFGGIMKCDTIAEGVLAAAREVGITVPLVVRLEGTNVELGRKLLEESDLDVISATSMADAAQRIVEAVRTGGGAQ